MIEDDDAPIIKKKHGHTIENCKHLHYLVKKLIKVRHLKQYVEIVGGHEEITCKALERTFASHVAHQAVINYIYVGPIDDKYHSKRERRRMLHVAIVREWVNTIQCTFTVENVRPVDGPTTFLPINPNRVILLHNNALVLTLGLDRFYVIRILIIG